MTEEEKLEKAKQEALENVKKTAEEAAKGVAEKSVKELNDKVAELTAQLEKATKSEDIEAVKKELTDSMNKLSADMKKQSQITMPAGALTSIGAIRKSLEQTVKENIGTIKGYQGGSLAIPMSKSISVDSFGVGGYADLTNQNLGLDINPFAPVYLRNIFPNVTTGGSNVTIWKRGAVTGKAAPWTRVKGEDGKIIPKPKVVGEWTKEVVNIDWIPAYTIIDREVLDDVDFMQTEIPQLLIYGDSGILRAENKVILDYIVANAVDYTLPAGFDAFENSLESILAAAFGQMGDKFLTPTHILINNWDYLKYLAFNKASGSGTYNYPNMTLTFINNRPYINGLQAVPNPDIEVGEAYVVAAARSRFIVREGIRQRISDSHAEIFTTNQIAYLAESRGAFFTYDDNSFVKVTLPTPAVETPAG
jgi:hypothetical protein